MAEDLNGYFSSVFTREDISSLPVSDAKFQEAKSDYLGKLIVTPQMVVKKIKAMEDNKSPGVGGIPPKLLMETVEQLPSLVPCISAHPQSGEGQLRSQEINFWPLW